VSAGPGEAGGTVTPIKAKRSVHLHAGTPTGFAPWPAHRVSLPAPLPPGSTARHRRSARTPV